MKGYPKWFSRRFISLNLSFLFFTGFLLIPITLDLQLGWEVPWHLSGEPRVMVTALHAFFSFASLVMVGSLASIHMRQGWKRRLRRTSGISLVGSFVLLTLTALGIYYFGNEQLSLIARLTHMALGISLPLLYVLHMSLRRRLLSSEIRGLKNTAGE